MASHEKQGIGPGTGTGGQDQIAGSRAEGYFAGGMEHYSNRRYAEAATAFGQALFLNPQHYGSLKHLGIARFHLELYPKALDCLQQFLEREPDDESALWYCGMARLELAQYPEAERIQRRLIAVNPRSSQGYRALGMIAYRRGLYPEAVNMLRKTLELEPADPEAFFQLGEAYNKLDQVDLAIECFEKVLEYQQENPKIYYNLGILYDKKALPDRASLMYRQAKELSRPGSERRSAVAPVKDAGDKGLFFSRALTVVADATDTSPASGVDAERYKNLRRLQKRRKQAGIVPEGIVGKTEKAGTMDLTKASLKIEEAIRNIKEKRN